MTFPVRGASLAVLLAGLASMDTSAQEWSRFRGPNGTGIGGSTRLPDSWTENDFRFRQRIPGESHSQPVIWGERIFLTTALEAGKERALICLKRSDGAELWRIVHPLPTHRPGNRNSGYANGSPVVDGRRVIACFASGEHFWVRSFDHDGKELWSRDLGRFASQHGHGASPIVHEGTVIVTNDQDGDSFVAALDLKDGKTLWQTARRGIEGGTAYATPAIHRSGAGPTEVLLCSQGHGVSSLDAATGEPNWEAPVFNKRMIASPIVAGEFVIGSCGSGGGSGNYLSAVKLGGKGNVGKTHVAYTLRSAAPYVPTPLFLDGRLYLVSDGGIASAVEAATGRVIWSERLGAQFFGSPVLADGKIFCPTIGGEMIVLAVGDTFKLVSRNPLGEGTHSSPAIDRGRIYVKTFTHLVCVGKP